MKENLKKMISYYKPYKRVFFIDMFFAIMASAIALVIPLVVRYVASNVGKMDAKDAVKQLIIIAIVVGALILFQCYCNYYIANEEQGITSIVDVTNETEKIYVKLAKPLQELENMEYGNTEI